MSLPGITLQMVEHIAQDLRADAHKMPDLVARNMRCAALVCDAYVQLHRRLGEMTDADPQPVPFPPPEVADAHR